MQFRVGRERLVDQPGCRGGCGRCRSGRRRPSASPTTPGRSPIGGLFKTTWLINGKTFNPARSDAFPVLGTTETWEIVNRTDVAHMMHIHHTDWYLLARDGKATAALGRLPQGDLLRLSRRTDPRRRPLRRLHRQVRDPLPHARPRGPRPDEPVRGRAVMNGRDSPNPRLSRRSAATLPSSAKRSSTLVVIEGFHALKHALRFGAELREAVAVDPQLLEELARELAPDLAGQLADRVTCASQSPARNERPRRGLPRPQARAALRRRYRGGGPSTRPAEGAPALEWPVVRAMRGGEGGDLHRRRGRRAHAIARGRRSNSRRCSPTRGRRRWSCSRAAQHGEHRRLRAGRRRGRRRRCPHHRRQRPLAPRRRARRRRAALRAAAGRRRAAHGAVRPSDRPLLAIDPEGEELRPDRLPPRAVLAFGTERHGISDELLERADARIAIPMREGVSSLNLATSVAVVARRSVHAGAP